MAEDFKPNTDDAEKAFAAAASEKVESAPKAAPASIAAVTVPPVEGEPPVAALDDKVQIKAEAKTKVKAEPKPKAVAAAKPVAKAKVDAAKDEVGKAVEQTGDAAKAVARAVKPVAAVASASVSDSITAAKDSNVADQTKKTADDLTAKVQDTVKEVQDRARTAFEKSKERLSEMGDFTKGNIEALRDSASIIATGVRNMGATYVEEAKANVAVLRADVKELTEVKSPTEFVKLQGSMMRKYFDTAVAANSKQTEAMRRLASEAFQPISNRVSLAREKLKNAA